MLFVSKLTTPSPTAMQNVPYLEWMNEWMNECLFIAKSSFLYNDLLRTRRPSGTMKHEVLFLSGLNIGFLSKGGYGKRPEWPKPLPWWTRRSQRLVSHSPSASDAHLKVPCKMSQTSVRPWPRWPRRPRRPASYHPWPDSRWVEATYKVSTS